MVSPEAVRSARQQHRLCVFQRLGCSVDHHDVAFLEFGITRRIAAEARKGVDQGRSDEGVPKIKDLAKEPAPRRTKR